MALIRAVRKNKIGQIEVLLSKGTDVNHTDGNGTTALTWAAILGHTHCVGLLIKHPRINPNIRNRWGDTPLFWAAVNSNKEMFSLLINHPTIDVNLLYNDSETILSLLVTHYCKETIHSEEMLFTLLRKGFYFDPRQKSPVESDKVNQVVYAFAGACKFNKVNLQKILLEIGVWRMVKIARVLEFTGEETGRLITKYLPPSLSSQTRNFIRGTVYENVGSVNPNAALEAMAHQNNLPLDARRCLLMQDRSLFTLN